MMGQNGLLKSRKSLTLDDIFHFDVFESGDGGVLYAHKHVAVDIAFYF